MSERDVSELVRRYEQMLVSGKSIYFDADEFDELAEYYESFEDFETASDIVESGLEMHPGNHSLLLKTGKYIVCEGNYSEAIEFFNQHFTSYDFDLYLLKIECFLQLDLYAEAYQLTKEVLEDEDTDLDIVLSELGFLYLEADYFNEAVLYLEKSLEYASDNLEVLTDLSYAYEMKGDFASAIKVSDKILDIDPYSFEAWLNIGKLYSLQENFDKAIDAFDFALTVSEGDESILKMKAHCLSLVGRTEEATAIFEECIKNKPDDAGLYLFLAECYLSLDRYDDMLLCLERCESISGKSSEIYAKKAAAYLQKGEADLALESVLDGLQIDPISIELNFIAGDIYFAREMYVESEACFSKILEEESQNQTALEKIASVCILQHNFTQAIEYLEQLLELQSDTSAVKRKLALLYFEVGDKERFLYYLDMLNDNDLRELFSLFYSESQLNPDSTDRAMLIKRLTEARECRILFKNLKY